MTMVPQRHAFALTALLALPTALILPAACASAQAAPTQVASGGTLQDDPAQPPNRAGDPTIRVEWMEREAAAPQVADDGSHLTVTGIAEVRAQPDRIRIFFAVETDAATAREAGEANASLMTVVSDALRASGAGVPGFRIETSGYSLTPRYGPPRGNQPQEIIGYVARNTVQVTADDVERAGPFIDVALEAGANRVAGLQFEVRDPEPHRHEAVRGAVRQARAEAEVMADALGMRLGPPVDVQGGADMYFPRGAVSTMARTMEMADATPIEPGQQSLTARVTIRFRLDPVP